MEFLRFGSSIPGTYWGCCAADIIQNFDHDPDTPASIQVVSGDGGGPILKNGKEMFLGKTYRDIFLNRIRIGTFSQNDMPNHAFFAIITESQCYSEAGKKWLKLLKDEGFEFIRAVDNSVYTGSVLNAKKNSHPNYIFGLFRNISGGKIDNQFKPPSAWTDLESRIPEVATELTANQQHVIQEQQAIYHTEVWKSRETVIYTEDELGDTPVWLAGLRSAMPQELKSHRKDKAEPSKTNPNPFGKVVVADTEEADYSEDFGDFEDCEDFISEED